MNRSFLSIALSSFLVIAAGCALIPEGEEASISSNIRCTDQREENGTTFVATYGSSRGEAQDWTSSQYLVQTADGGYVISGTGRTGWGGADYFILKTDALGFPKWAKSLGGYAADNPHSLILTKDGGYLISGNSNSLFFTEWRILTGKSARSILVLKLDATGNTEWATTIDAGGADTAVISTTETTDGGYALTGIVIANNKNQGEVLLAKLDYQGQIEWARTFGGEQEEAGWSLAQTSDNGYAIAGYTISSESKRTDAVLLKTDVGGNLQWSRTYGTTDYVDVSSLIEKQNGGYMLAGRFKSPDSGKMGILTLSIDRDGELLEAHGYHNAETSEATRVIQTIDGGFAIVGWIGTEDAAKALLIETAANGDLQRSMVVEGSAQMAQSLIQTKDGGYAISGTDYSNATAQNSKSSDRQPKLLLVKLPGLSGELECIERVSLAKTTPLLKSASVDYVSQTVSIRQRYVPPLHLRQKNRIVQSPAPHKTR